MKFKLILFFLLALPAFLTFSQNRAKKLDAAIEKTKSEKNYTGALQLIDKKIASNPTDEYNYIDQAYVYVSMRKIDDAFKSVEHAFNLNGKNPEVYNTAGYLFQVVQDFEKAISAYTTAYQLTPADSMGQQNCYIINRSTAEAQSRRFEDAYKDAMYVFQRDSTSIGVLNNLAAVLDDVGKPEEGIRILKKMIEIDPTFIGSYINLGFKYSQLGQYEKALTYFDKALSLDATDALAYNNRGYAKYKLGKLEDALKDVNRSMELFPGNTYANRNRALIYIEMKRISQACDEIEKGLKGGFTQMYGDELEKLKKQHCN